MKKIPKKKRKVTELYFNEYDGTAEIYTYNTKLKKRLTAYAATYPDLCQLIEDDENGGLRFEIDKHRVSIRLTAPYSEDRKAIISQQSCFSKPLGKKGNSVISYEVAYEVALFFGQQSIWAVVLFSLIQTEAGNSTVVLACPICISVHET